LPSKKVTLHMAQPLPREGIVEVLKQVSESNGLKFTDSGPLIRIDGPEPQQPQRGNQQNAFQNAQQQQQLQFFTYRLRHASAVQLAPVLMNLFTGVGNTGGGFSIPGPNGGFTVINPGIGPAGGNTTATVDIGAAVNAAIG